MAKAIKIYTDNTRYGQECGGMELLYTISGSVNWCMAILENSLAKSNKAEQMPIPR